MANIGKKKNLSTEHYVAIFLVGLLFATAGGELMIDSRDMSFTYGSIQAAEIASVHYVYASNWWGPLMIAISAENATGFVKPILMVERSSGVDRLTIACSGLSDGIARGDRIIYSPYFFTVTQSDREAIDILSYAINYLRVTDCERMVPLPSNLTAQALCPVSMAISSYADMQGSIDTVQVWPANILSCCPDRVLLYHQYQRDGTFNYVYPLVFSEIGVYPGNPVDIKVKFAEDFQTDLYQCLIGYEYVLGGFNYEIVDPGMFYIGGLDPSVRVKSFDFLNATHIVACAKTATGFGLAFLDMRATVYQLSFVSEWSDVDETWNNATGCSIGVGYTTPADPFRYDFVIAATESAIVHGLVLEAGVGWRAFKREMPLVAGAVHRCAAFKVDLTTSDIMILVGQEFSGDNRPTNSSGLAMFRASDVECSDMTQESEVCVGFGCAYCKDTGDCIGDGMKCPETKKGKKSQNVPLVVGVSVGLSVAFVIAVVGAVSVATFRYAKTIRNRQVLLEAEMIPLRTRLGLDLRETFEPGDSRFVDINGLVEIRISVAKLDFGCSDSQAPIDEELTQRFTLKNQMRCTATYKFFPPNDPRFSICFVPPCHTIRPDETAEIVATCTMRCTTDLKSAITVAFSQGSKWKNSLFHTTIPMELATVLSPNLDPQEITLDDKIGEGSFGIVYKGKWRGQVVAIKLLKNQEFADDETVSEFRKEVDVLQRLRNQYVVNFVGACLFPSHFCIVTEYMPHKNLRACMLENAFSDVLKLKCLLDCANGMSFLHTSGIFHRDVKPDNLLVASLDESATVNCKLTDFGSTRNINKVDATQNYTKGVGTPTYMAPEILQANRYSQKADVYSFAVLVWFVIAEKEPYSDHQTMWGIAEFVISGKRLALPDCNLRNLLGELLDRCWAPNPHDRPEFSEIVPVLEKVLLGLKS
jgi:hypothetical protein